MNLKNFIQEKEGLHKRINMAYFHLCDIIEQVKFNYGEKNHSNDCLRGDDKRNFLGRGMRNSLGVIIISSLLKLVCVTQAYAFVNNHIMVHLDLYISMCRNFTPEDEDGLRE